MRLSKTLFVLLAWLAFAVSCAPGSGADPTVSISPSRASAQSYVSVHGTGFTPNENVSSHLLLPDGSELPVLPILTDGEGEFRHEIDTLLLDVGMHELWVVDDASNVTSNVARFEVTGEQAPL